MSNLDVNTPKGQESVEDEQIMLKQIRKVWELDVVETPKKEAAKIDTMLIRDNVLVGITENKCRYNMYLKDDHFYLSKYNKTYDSWLITNEKIESGRILAGALCVPFFGFLHLVDDDTILWWKIASGDGKFLIDFDRKESETQATINGGTIMRENAYLPIEHAHNLHDFWDDVCV
jgi:hypothetical protein